MTIADPPAVAAAQRAALAPEAGPSKAERAGIAAFFALVIVFGAVVEMRSAFLTHRRTDLDVYLRAAWAVRAGADIYTITDENQWHYHYPPLFAIAMVPLADPPPGADRTGTLPFAVSVAVWYALNVVFLALAAHLLAGALEKASADPAVRSQPRGRHRWWALRMIPIAACSTAIGATLARGEVNLLLLLMLCATAAAVIRGRSWQAGLWLAGAICLKLIPALLLLYPLWRRNVRMLGGCAMGLAVGFVLVPVAVFGPLRALEYYREWNRVLIEPALVGGRDQSRTRELVGITSTDSQSFQTIIYNTWHLPETLFLDRGDRPAHLTTPIRAAHWLLGGLMSAATLWAAGAAAGGALAELLLLGALMIVMILLSPVCHLHYFALALPLVMGLVAAAWEESGTEPLSAGWRALLAWNVAGNGLPHLPGLQLLKDLGLAMYTALLLWVAGLAVLWKRRQVPLARSAAIAQTSER